MKFVTSISMKELERRTAAAGISYDDMMENAGRAAAGIIAKKFPVKGCRMLVLCGRGNNGGDGFVAARELSRAGAEVTVLLWKGLPTAETASKAFGTLPAQVRVLDRGEAMAGQVIGEVKEIRPHLTVDAIYGAGFRGKLAQRDEELFASGIFPREATVSLDLPSGVESDTGRYQQCLPGRLCIAMGYLKPAHLLSWRRDYLEEIALAEFPLCGTEGCVFETVGPESLPPRRLPWGHKGTNGRLGLVCGSRQFPGAARLAAMGGLRAGAGYVRLISTGYVCQAAAAALPEVIYTPCRENGEGALPAWELDRVLRALEGCDAAVVGCGLTNCADTAALVRGILEEAGIPVILDADGLNVLAGEPQLLSKARCPLMVTPHLGEFSRFFGVHMDEAERDACGQARAAAQKYSVTVLLKGPVTVIAAPGETLRCSFLGNSGLSKGGSGDVLSGILGAMAARGLPLFRAAQAGAWLHGKAADLAAAKLGTDAMLPSDLAGELGNAFWEAAAE